MEFLKGPRTLPSTCQRPPAAPAAADRWLPLPLPLPSLRFGGGGGGGGVAARASPRWGGEVRSGAARRDRGLVGPGS